MSVQFCALPRADRAAFDLAIDLGLLLGGWWPEGRLAKDGTIDLRYRLQIRWRRASDHRGKRGLRPGEAGCNDDEHALESD